MKDNIPKYFIVAIVVFLVILVLSQNNRSPSTNTYTTNLVRLEVLGDEGASITYTNDTGGTEQFQTNKLPWTKVFECTGKKYFYLSAQANNYGSSIEVRIKLNGSVVKEAKSHGDFVIASTSAIIE